MTRVDFYVSPNNAQDADLQLVCRIVDKAWQQQNQVYVHAASAEQAKRLDDLLWLFRDGAFIPHCQATDPVSAETPIVIGVDAPPEMKPEVLINLGQEVPGFFSRFERVVEIVAGDENHRAQARQRFRFYRERGYPLETHELNS
ncbi:MAG: DNA polymerase III subunit chi [Gammaproteobacteria bacterium]|nr:DNA polymerase III subunit chi [Gammaproteobacteria bacterium]